VSDASNSGDGIIKFEKDGELITYNLKIDRINESFRG